MQSFIVLALVGLLAQLVDGSLGMAYGVTSTTLLLASGLPPATASASVHLAEVGTTLLSGAAHWRFGNVDWTVVRRIALPGAIGAFLGATALSNISTEIAAPWMSALLLTLGVVVLLRFAFGRAPSSPRAAAIGRPQLGTLGIIAGFIDATGGGGWGPVATPTLLASGSMAPRKVIGSVDTSEFVVALAASIGFLLALGQEGISFAPVGALLLGGLIAAPLAAWLVRHIPAPLLGIGAGGLIILTNVRTIFNAIGVADGTRALAYLTIAIGWAAALAYAVRRQQREPDAWAEPEPIGAS
jgi:uncharacterized membrane protein YfcA